MLFQNTRVMHFFFILSRLFLSEAGDTPSKEYLAITGESVTIADLTEPTVSKSNDTVYTITTSLWNNTTNTPTASLMNDKADATASPENDIAHTTANDTGTLQGNDTADATATLQGNDTADATATPQVNDTADSSTVEKSGRNPLYFVWEPLQFKDLRPGCLYSASFRENTRPCGPNN